MTRQPTAIGGAPHMHTDQPTTAVDLFNPLNRLEPAPTTPPAGGRGYPLPPWALEARRPAPEELETWLTGDLTLDQRRAYLEAWQGRHEEAQRLASDRALKVLDVLDTVDVLRRRTTELEELYAAASRPALVGNVEVDLDDPRWTALRVTLAYDREAAPDLDEAAAARITEAAAVGAFQAYERERVAAAVVDYKAEQATTI